MFTNKKLLISSIKKLLSLLVLVLITSIITYLINPDITSAVKSVSSNIPNSLENKKNLDLVWAYIINNGLKVPGQMFILSLIPIPFLYWIQPIITSILPGILFGIAFRLSFQKGVAIFISATPHMLIELLAFSFLLVVLHQNNNYIISKISKNRNPDTTFLLQIKKLCSVYIIYVLPLIIIAAFLETYVADFILNIIN